MSLIPPMTRERQTKTGHVRQISVPTRRCLPLEIVLKVKIIFPLSLIFRFSDGNNSQPLEDRLNEACVTRNVVVGFDSATDLAFIGS